MKQCLTSIYQTLPVASYHKPHTHLKVLLSKKYCHLNADITKNNARTCGSASNGQQIRFGVYCKSHKIKTGDKVDMSTENCQKDLEWSRTGVFRTKMWMLTTQKSRFFPTCQVRVVWFYVSSTPSFLRPSFFRRTSTASSRSQWSPPDANRKPRIRVVPAGPEQQAQIECQTIYAR